MRSFALSQAASSLRCQSSPRWMPSLNRQCWCSGNAAQAPSPPGSPASRRRRVGVGMQLKPDEVKHCLLTTLREK